MTELAPSNLALHQSGELLSSKLNGWKKDRWKDRQTREEIADSSSLQ